MKILIGLSLYLFSLGSVAQQHLTLDGTWIKSSIDAFDRVNVTRNGTSEDEINSIAFLSYVGGILAVHRHNNMRAAIAVSGLSEAKKASKSTAASAEIDKQMKVVFYFVPLLRVPDSLSPQQIVAIHRKYLEANPEKWNIQAALLITNAFEAAFKVCQSSN